MANYAVYLFEAGLEINVIRGWLEHANLEATNRYAEITNRMKAEALKPGARTARPASKQPFLCPAKNVKLDLENQRLAAILASKTSQSSEENVVKSQKKCG